MRAATSGNFKAPFNRNPCSPQEIRSYPRRITPPLCSGPSEPLALRLLPAADKQLEFLVTTDERRCPRAQGLEAAQTGEGVNPAIPYVMWKNTPYEHLMIPVR